MTIYNGLRLVYRELLAFIRKLWWIALLLIIPMLANSSITDSWIVWQSLPLMICWLAIGLISQLVVFYVLIRFLALQGNSKGALSFDAASMRTYCPFAVLWVAWGASNGVLTGSDGLAAAMTVVGTCFVILLSPWAVSTPSGDNTISPWASCRAAAPHTFWSIGFLLAVFVPLVMVRRALLVGFLTYGGEGQYHMQWAGLQMLLDMVAWLLGVISMHVIAHKAGLKFAAHD